jgi:hypothetical protein
MRVPWEGCLMAEQQRKYTPEYQVEEARLVIETNE